MSQLNVLSSIPAAGISYSQQPNKNKHFSYVPAMAVATGVGAAVAGYRPLKEYSDVCEKFCKDNWVKDGKITEAENKIKDCIVDNLVKHEEAKRNFDLNYENKFSDTSKFLDDLRNAYLNNNKGEFNKLLNAAKEKGVPAELLKEVVKTDGFWYSKTFPNEFNKWKVEYFDEMIKEKGITDPKEIAEAFRNELKNTPEGQQLIRKTYNMVSFESTRLEEDKGHFKNKYGLKSISSDTYKRNEYNRSHFGYELYLYAQENAEKLKAMKTFMKKTAIGAAIGAALAAIGVGTYNHLHKS